MSKDVLVISAAACLGGACLVLWYTLRTTPVPQGVSEHRALRVKSRDSDARYQQESRNLLNLLYTLAEDQARKEGYVHRGITCNTCTVSPVRGVRYKCANCVDYDLCETCESANRHTPTHVFLKIRIPIPPLANPRSALLPGFYPGGKGEVKATLKGQIFRALQKDTHFDNIELEALYEQYKALSTVDAPEGGVEKEIFENCLGPLGVEKNLVTERIFQFFDKDGDGIISFSEMVRAMSVLCKGTHDEKVKYAFEGYDLDQSGEIGRDELRKMFKSYFYLSMELVRDVIRGLEEEMVDEAWDEDDDPQVPPTPATPADAHFTTIAEMQSPSFDNVLTPTSGALSSQSVFTFAPGHTTHRSSYSGSRNALCNLAKGTLRRRSSAAVSRAQQQAEKGEMWPVLEAMSQDAIDEIVEDAFAKADANRDGKISFSEFKAWAKQDSTCIAWFEALGSVF